MIAADGVGGEENRPEAIIPSGCSSVLPQSLSLVSVPSWEGQLSSLSSEQEG